MLMVAEIFNRVRRTRRGAGDVAMSMTEGLQTTRSRSAPRSSARANGVPCETHVVRVLGCLIIGCTIACLVRLARHPPARQAILRWGLFGQSERILPAGRR